MVVGSNGGAMVVGSNGGAIFRQTAYFRNNFAGFASSGSAAYGNGGAIYSEGRTTFKRNSVFENNDAGGKLSSVL